MTRAGFRTNICSIKYPVKVAIAYATVQITGKGNTHVYMFTKWTPVTKQVQTCIISCLSISDQLMSAVCLYKLNCNIIVSSTTGPISTKLSTKHPWVKGIEVWHKASKG